MAATGQHYESKVIAQLFGVSVRRIQQLTQEGIIETTQVPGEGRRYELVPTIQAYTKYLADKAYGREQSDREAELKEQKMKADIALKESQGELHRLKTDIAAGKYIAVEEVRMDYERFFVTFKNFAMSLPTRLVDEISSYVEPLEARRIEKELHQRVRNLLVAFVVAGVTDDGKKETPPHPQIPGGPVPEGRPRRPEAPGGSSCFGVGGAIPGAGQQDLRHARTLEERQDPIPRRDHG